MFLPLAPFRGATRHPNTFVCAHREQQELHFGKAISWFSNVFDIIVLTEAQCMHPRIKDIENYLSQKVPGGILAFGTGTPER